MSRYDVDPAILEETRSRYDALCGRIEALKTSTAEQWKTMETAERSLLTMAGTAELDCRAQFSSSGREPPARPTETALAKQRGDQIETAQFYVTVRHSSMLWYGAVLWHGTTLYGPVLCHGTGQLCVTVRRSSMARYGAAVLSLYGTAVLCHGTAL